MNSRIKKLMLVGLLACGVVLVAGCRNYNPAEGYQGRDMAGAAAGHPSGSGHGNNQRR
jgi:hypothetical protein